MNFIPLGNRIMVEDIIEKHHGMIAISPMTKEKPTGTGTVIALGDTINNPKAVGGATTQVAVGDIIYRGEFIGQIVKVDGKEYRVMNISDVLGKLG